MQELKKLSSEHLAFAEEPACCIIERKGILADAKAKCKRLQNRV